MEIVNLNKICGGCAAANLGTKLDTLEKDLAEGNVYSGDLLTEDEENALNNICPVLSELSLGTYINNVLKASKDGNEIENLTDEQVAILNNQTCGGFSAMEVGTKIHTFVEEINDAPTPTPAEANFLTFYVKEDVSDGEQYDGVINSGNSTVNITVPYNTPVNAFKVFFTVSSGAIVKYNNTEIHSGEQTNYNFTSPQTFTVIGSDGTTTKDWVVTVTILPQEPSQWQVNTSATPVILKNSVTFDTTGSIYTTISQGLEQYSNVENGYLSPEEGVPVYFMFLTKANGKISLTIKDGSDSESETLCVYNETDAGVFVKTSEYTELTSPNPLHINGFEGSVDDCDEFTAQFFQYLA